MEFCQIAFQPPHIGPLARFLKFLDNNCRFIDYKSTILGEETNKYCRKKLLLSFNALTVKKTDSIIIWEDYPKTSEDKICCRHKKTKENGKDYCYMQESFFSVRRYVSNVGRSSVVVARRQICALSTSSFAEGKIFSSF